MRNYKNNFRRNRYKNHSDRNNRRNENGSKERNPIFADEKLSPHKNVTEITKTQKRN